ncbi:MAG: aminotransferase class I/II-fold pyridoxal phosphate-dependent enzyme [Planctomycetaceae bacterium]
MWHEVGQCEDVRQVMQSQTGATASALVCGRSSWHAALENALAEFEDTQAALLFPTGFAANLGVLTGLVEAGDAVFCDRDNHASLIDAARSCAGRLLVYRSNDLSTLQRSLKRRRCEHERVYIVTDGVFSMDGRVAALSVLCEIAEQHQAAVIVDEAHGTGVLGSHGRGACDLCDVEGRVLLRIGTMSKAMGGLGGFVVGDRPIIDLLRNVARTQFFSTALPPAICAAMLQSLKIITAEPQRRERLAELVAFAHQTLADFGLQTVDRGVAPIVSVLIPGSHSVQDVSQRLHDAGFFLPAIRPPTVAAGTDRLRMSLSVQHTTTQIKAALQQIAR